MNQTQPSQSNFDNQAFAESIDAAMQAAWSTQHDKAKVVTKPRSKPPSLRTLELRDIVGSLDHLRYTFIVTQFEAKRSEPHHTLDDRDETHLILAVNRETGSKSRKYYVSPSDTLRDIFRLVRDIASLEDREIGL